MMVTKKQILHHPTNAKPSHSHIYKEDRPVVARDGGGEEDPGSVPSSHMGVEGGSQPSVTLEDMAFSCGTRDTTIHMTYITQTRAHIDINKKNQMFKTI